MILVDANLLIYAKFSDFPQHAPARALLESALNSGGRVGLPWPTLLAFLRIATNPRLFDRPLSIAHAWEQVGEWIDHPRVWIPQPIDGHVEALSSLLRSTGATGNLVPDAHLAALAITHGLTLCSADSDFARFTDLEWENPIRSSRP